MTTDHQGAVGDARKRRQPEVEFDPTALRGQLEYALERADGALNQMRRAEKQRDEASVRVSELEHRLVVADEKVAELERRLLIVSVSDSAESGEHEFHRNRTAHLERSMRALIVRWQEDNAIPVADVIQAISDALEVKGS